MFREVALNPKDSDFHHFLIRDPPSSKILDARMVRLTFEVTFSPFLTTSVLQQIANYHRCDHPRAAQVVLSKFYVDDDFFTGTDTVEEAVTLRRELCELLGNGGMLLRKWRSSSDLVLDTIPDNLRKPTDTTHLLNLSDQPKALGVHWST